MNILTFLNMTLKEKGYDGLVNPGECGCLADDLSAGGCLTDCCEPGYKHSHSERPEEWAMFTEKAGVTDENIQYAQKNP